MTIKNATFNPQERVDALLDEYGSAGASAAYLLCDRHDPKAVAYTIVSPDLSSVAVTYGELRRESERLAASFYAIGIRPGDRIATLMGKSRTFLVVLQAIWRLGAVHVPLFTAFAAPAISMRLNASATKLVLCDDDQHSKLIDAEVSCQVISVGANATGEMTYASLLKLDHPGVVAAALGGDAPLIQIYTSGTTGKPKGVIVPQRALASFYGYMEFGLGVVPGDVFWNGADPGWAYGLYFGVIGTFLTGANSLLLQGSFAADTTYAILERYKVTNFAAAPTVYRSLRASSALVPQGLALRRASSAGEPLTPDVNEWASANLGVKVHDHYGQTETGMLICNQHYPDLSRDLKSGSMGQSLPGWKAVVLQSSCDEVAPAGELGRVALDLSRSPFNWFAGYVDEPQKSAEKFSADGRWYHTGDLARIDADGDFFFASRDDDVIIMAGYRIGPFEIESVLATHPAIIECSVVAMPDEIRGEVLEAAVVLRQGNSPSSELTQSLQEWVKKHYAAHAYPRKIHYFESLPKTPSGKVQRFVIRQQLREKLLTS